MGDFEVRDQLVRAGGHAEIADDLDVGWNSRLVGGGAMHGVVTDSLMGCPRHRSTNLTICRPLPVTRSTRQGHYSVNS